MYRFDLNEQKRHYEAIGYIDKLRGTYTYDNIIKLKYHENMKHNYNLRAYKKLLRAKISKHNQKVFYLEDLKSLYESEYDKQCRYTHELKLKMLTSIKK
jgi:hypothetical protein